ncbi:ATP-binding protein [endosymbiont of Lamellibrachia barhami]|uniref:ATP-binding protein n=1 Tax=endosymbiont of Lamellibrachia barhami TaxID=205975 RepID=UPI001FE4D924|nr:ATP-binding protein [endosymbiont of Lamellibrachia barhami]
MNLPDNLPTRIHRSFHELSDEAITANEQTSILTQMGWSGAFGWDVLLTSQRVLIVSEAGAGKTYECQSKQTALWKAGEAAFYLDLAELSRNNLHDLLLAEEEERFDAWLASQSDVATIFLDSIDELKLTLGSFEAALKRLNKAMMGQLGRVRIVITTRPIPVDYRLIQQLLPIPQKNEPTASDEAFADIVMNKQHDNEKDDKTTNAVPEWRNVALMPLSDDQIREMAALQGVTEADALIEDIRKRNAEDFARRLQDLIELCTDWRDHRRIRTHHEQVAHNITNKLKPRTDRAEKVQLTEEKALEGASRLALAALLTRKLTLRHSAEADKGGEPGTALDPAAILPNWSANERETLLERALFGFASYGRVRFHHRSVIEYLAAQRLVSKLDCGMTMKAVKRLLFAKTPQGIKVVKPSMRPVAAWLAFSQPTIFCEVRNREPNVLLDYADPESLTPPQRIDALRTYVEHYGQGTWRGMHVPRVQVHRFASNELAPEVLRLWKSGIENPEVRELLLELVAAVPMRDGADIAYSVVMQGDADSGERIDALEALIKLNDSRLEAVTLSMETDPDIWSNRLLKASIQKLFPTHIPVERLCHILSQVTESPHNAHDLNWFWTHSIAEGDMTHSYLEEFCAGLTNLVTESAEWNKERHHIVTPRQHLVAPLAAVCLRQLKEGGPSGVVVNSSVMALRFARDEYSHNEPASDLRKTLSQLPAPAREAAFWADDAFNQSLHSQEDPWNRLYEVGYRGAIRLNASQDASWILANLSDQKRPIAERAMMLETAVRQVWDGQGEWRDYVLTLKDRVADCPTLAARIDDHLNPAPVNRELARMEAQHQKRSKQAKRRQAKDHASWILFWRDVANNPETAFSPDRAGNTAWNLWQAMERSGLESRASGWNRRFIEQHFSKEIADRLRSAMTSIWRDDRPTLRSERPEGEKGTFLIRWQLGLAAIAAEAEDPSWARKLPVDEAKLAARYAPIELNGFPSWLESLAEAHPTAVEDVLGPELLIELDEIATTHSHSTSLQNISYAAPPLATLFFPRLRAWFDENVQRIREGEDNNGVAERLRKVVDVLLKYGDNETREHIRTMAVQQLASELDPVFGYVWLPILMRLDPGAGAEQLEQGLSGVEPEPQGPGVVWIALLFGDRHSGGLIDLRKPEFTPALLLRLVCLAYRYVRPSEDIIHESTYSPGNRDHAQQGRDALLSALLDAKGPEGWEAKIEMADNPLFAHFRDRALLLAREKAAEESDGVALSESEVIALDRNREAPPATRDEMFALLVDRLDDLDDLLLHDDSPRAAWAGISDEKVMRREIARELRNAANHAYTVDQESVTADEKETDIRLRSAISDQQAVIELKLGDGRTGRDLRDTVKEQLVTKYMAPDTCRSGCLLVAVSKDRTWEHPDSNKRLNVAGLKAMLQAEASNIVTEMGLALLLTTRVLDLRPRLPTEKASATVQKRELV